MQTFCGKSIIQTKTFCGKSIFQQKTFCGNGILFIFATDFQAIMIYDFQKETL